MNLTKSCLDWEANMLTTVLCCHPHPHSPPNPLPTKLKSWFLIFSRIQIHFKNEADKPVDVVHYLKLDKTYTGEF